MDLVPKITELGVDDIPNGSRVFAVGDIHGCASELEILLDYLISDEVLSDEEFVIFLGDYIDRGTDSRKVIDRLIEFKSKHKNSLFLKGNHEDMLLSLLGLGGMYGEYCLVNGGSEFFKEYGLEDYVQYVGQTEWCMVTGATPGELASMLPEDHLSFLRDLISMIVHPEFIFVHAGIDPMNSIDSQRYEDLHWIRYEFLDGGHKNNQIVVHGHTPFEKVNHQLLGNVGRRIGIDTGCFKGGMLTAIELRSLKTMSVPSGTVDVLIETI